MAVQLSVEDIFYLFNQACTTTGNPGYQGKLAQQSAKAIAAWTEFHKELMQYMPTIHGAKPAPIPTASKINAVRATEDAISADVKKYEFNDQKIMYRMLYNIGHRINQ